MFFSFSVLFYVIVFVLCLEITTFKEGWFLYLLFPLTLIMVPIFKKSSKQWLFSIPSISFSLAAFFMLYFVDFGITKQMFIFLSGLVLYLSLLGGYRLGKYAKDQTARGMVSASLMATVFFLYSAGYGAYLNFYVPIWTLMAFYFFVTFLLTLVYIRIINAVSKKKIEVMYSFLLGFSMMELAWVINFWPFGYLTTGVISLILYYILWDFVQSYFLDILSKKRVVANSVFFVCIIIVILTTSRWMPNIY